MNSEKVQTPIMQHQMCDDLAMNQIETAYTREYNLHIWGNQMGGGLRDISNVIKLGETHCNMRSNAPWKAQRLPRVRSPRSRFSHSALAAIESNWNCDSARAKRIAVLSPGVFLQRTNESGGGLRERVC